MPARFLILFSLPLFWLAGCANAPAGAEAYRTGHVTMITGDFPVLASGMSAEEIRLKLGDPADIRPMNRPEGNAEIWVYYLEKYLGKTQIATFVNRPSFSGAFANDPNSLFPEQVYILADQKVQVTLSLLMFNGRLVTQSAKSEQRIEY